MAIIDWILLAPLLYGAWRGFQKGLLLEIAGLLALIVGLFGAFKLLHESVLFLQKHIDIPQILPAIAFILVFIAIVILVNLAAKLFKKWIHGAVFVGVLDQWAGALVGVLKWSFGVSTLCWLLHHASFLLPKAWQKDAMLYPWLLKWSSVWVSKLGLVLPFLRNLFAEMSKYL